MKIINLQGGQGSDAWLQFRAGRFGSSEAAAMLGLSPYTTRNELLKLKHLGIAKDFGEWFQAKVLDHGHAVEAATRPMIEDEIGDDLYPVTCVESDDSPLVASCDGLTLDGATAWECKQWNEALADAVISGTVPDTHMPQCQHILMVTGAGRLLFTVSDGQARQVSTEVLPSPEWFSRLRAGWAQFQKDLAAYQLPAAAEVVTAAPQEHLPAVSVQVQGSLSVVSNLVPFGAALRAFVAKIPKKPSTDQEFANTEAACKRLKEAEEKLQAAEDQSLASMSDVNEMRTAVAELRDLARSTRLAAERLVKARKEQIREEEVTRGVGALRTHITGLNERIGRPLMPPIPSDFGGVIKGLKTIDSLRNAIDTELARAKIAASTAADSITVNLRTIDATDAPHLFPDLQALVLKAPDDLAAVIAQRVAAEQQRKDAAEQRVRDEEAARLAAAAAAPPPAPAVAAVPARRSFSMQAPAAYQAPAPRDEQPDDDLDRLLAHIAQAFDCKFPTHPKPSPEWWAGLRTLADRAREALAA